MISVLLAVASIQAHAVTLGEAKNAIGGSSAGETGSIICNDTDTSIPSNRGLNVAAKEAFIYFNEAVASEPAEVEKVLLEAKNNELSPVWVEGSASIIPWGKSGCMGNKAIYSNTEKLVACNKKLAEDRANNVATIAKKIFGGIDQIQNSKSITSRVQYSDRCKHYDDTKKEVYHKYQYVRIKFGAPRCSEAQLFTSVGQIGMNGGKCSGVCEDEKSGMLADKTPCSRYVRLTKPTTIEFDAQQVPDKFTMIKVSACKKAQTDTTGYISTVHNYINNPSLVDKYRFTEVKALTHYEILYNLHCDKDISATSKAVYSCSRGTRSFECLTMALGTIPNGCKKISHEGINYDVSINPPVKLDQLNQTIPNIPNASISFKLKNINSNNKLVKSINSDLAQLALVSRNDSPSKDKLIQHKLKEEFKDVDVPMENGRTIKLKALVGIIEKSKGRAVAKSPVKKTYEPGDYCLQVEAPDQGTVWTAK